MRARNRHPIAHNQVPTCSYQRGLCQHRLHHILTTLQDLETTRTIQSLWVPDGDYWSQPETIASILMQVFVVIFLCVTAHRFRKMVGSHPGAMNMADEAIAAASRLAREEEL
jgi:hypothetical protein